MSDVTATELAATVRDAVKLAYDPPSEAHSALEALLDRCEEAEQDARSWRAQSRHNLDERAATVSEVTRLTADLDAARKALRQCRELFIDLRGDWSDNRGPCREGITIIDAALASPSEQDE